MPSYLTTCPKCGRQLQPRAADPQCAPWICTPCGLGFFVCELTADARKAYRARCHDWGVGRTRLDLSADRRRELEDARERGTSARPEQLPLLGASDRGALLRRRLHPDFARLVESA